MKRFLALILAILMCLFVTACDDGGGGGGGKDDDDEITCSACGEENSEDALYCKDCGTKLSKIDTPAPSPQSCKTCDGEGKIECEKCDGRGYFPTEYGYRLLCSDCREGYSDCPDCEEKEPETSPVSPNNPISPNNPVSPITPSPKNCVRCNNTGRITCTFCNGAGGWDETKYSTDYTGNGGTPYTVHQTCRTCGGNKFIDCPNC